MSWWLISGTSVAALATLIILIRVIRQGEKADELQRVNRDLNKELDGFVEASHRQEKREADHEARLVEIALTHNLSRERIRMLLDTWPGESPKAGASQSPSP